MASPWPDWAAIEEMVKTENYMAGNSEFNVFKKTVLKASVEEIDEQVEHAPAVWDFLIGFAAIKKMYRSLILQVFNKLTQVPSWTAAFDRERRLHAKIRTLHEDLQAALGAQHNVIMNSITPEALKAMSSMRHEEQPEQVRMAAHKEKMVDAIREEAEIQDEEAFGNTADDVENAEAPTTPNDPSAAALQEAFDAVEDLDEEAQFQTAGIDALNLLRIACIRCVGQEEILEKELDHAHKVFSFLFGLVRRRPQLVSGVAEVVNVLVQSPSWSGLLETSPPLQEALRDLPVDVQAALGLQHEKVMRLVDTEARSKATKGEIPDVVKGVAVKMSVLHRPARPESSAAGAAQPRQSAAAATGPTPSSKKAARQPRDEWKEAKAPTGHAYYYNLATKATTWERPAALGGLHTYKVGDTVEVWSNSQRVWGNGKVERVEGDRIFVEFSLPNGTVAKKELSRSHRDLRPTAQRAAREGWSSQEKAAYQQHWESLPGDKSAKSANTVAQFLMASRLPRPALKQVWAVSNPGCKVKVGLEEFARCCRLVAHCQGMGKDSPLLLKAERPLRVKLREECLSKRPPALPCFT